MASKLRFLDNSNKLSLFIDKAEVEIASANQALSEIILTVLQWDCKLAQELKLVNLD